MNQTTHAATTQPALAPGDSFDKRFLEAIRDPEKRKEVIAILKRAGSVPV